jgi:hypothetical protein
MFEAACIKVRESLYGILCQTDVRGRPHHFGSGTGFLIAPQLCLTAAHVLHHDGQKNAPVHSRIQVIRAPEVGQPMRMARLLGIDDALDLALLQIDQPGPIDPARPIAGQNPSRPAIQHSDLAYLALHPETPSPGTPCGSLGYPLSTVGMKDNQVAFTLIERFQGSYISSRRPELLSDGRLANIVETDGLMYGGSSGCPGFTTDGQVWGLHFATITEQARAIPAPQKQQGGSDQRNPISNPQQDSDHPTVAQPSGARLAISLWVSSTEIRAFAARCGVVLAE